MERMEGKTRDIKTEYGGEVRMGDGKKERLRVLLYLFIYLAVALTVALNQPLHDTPPSFCNPPDEHARYLVPRYICEHGVLPTGFETELMSGECRWTYGFYTLFPYMVQGYAMRFVNLFTDSELALLYTARFVNILSGLFMAWIVYLLAKKLFRDERFLWLFCFLVMFLPQSLFIHTYVNPDSFCLTSTALMLYGLVRGYGDGFSKGSCAILSAGVIVCALSYYNAYGFILSGMLLFAAYFLKTEDGKKRYDFRSFFKRGLPMAAVVLVCISWSFIRNYILYDGDIIGLNTMQDFIKSFGIPRDTYRSTGRSILSMLFQTTFFPKLAVSFIACYGSATLYTSVVVYLFYLLVLVSGAAASIFLRSGVEDVPGERRWLRRFFHANMTACILIPVILLIRYAYSVDYQAQGRYVLPALIPIMYYVSRGLQKLFSHKKCLRRAGRILYCLVMAGILLSLFYTVFVSALPFYRGVPVL